MKALPNPSDSEQQQKQSQEHRGTGEHRQPGPVPSIDELLEQLAKLNGAVVMGLISPKVANIVQKNIKILIDVQMKRANGERAIPDMAALVEMCLQNPRCLNAIASFLTPSQLQFLMDEIEGSVG